MVVPIPTISAVTPSLNQGEFIEDAIRSVISQEGDFYIDYIIMDGGSTDNSVEIIKGYEQLLKSGKWPVKCMGIEYTWVSEKDRGQADAINRGFLRAIGEIGVWLNSDDYFYDTNVFSHVVSAFSKDETLDLLIGDGILVDRNKNYLGKHHTDRIDEEELLFLDYHILQPSAFLKTEHYRKRALSTNFTYCFDVDFFIGLILSGIRYKKIDQTLSCFRFYPENKTASGGKARFREFMAIEKKYSRNILKIGISSVYKYLEVVLRKKYKQSRLFDYIFPFMRNIFYLMLLGTWGRK